MEALRPNVKAVLTDEIKTLMVNNDAPIGIGYSGDAAYVMSENPAITYVVPNDGGAIWTDNFAIPKPSAILKELMRLSISCCVLKNAAQNAEYVGYATPSETAKQLLPTELTSNKAFYPEPEAMQQMEHYEYLGKNAVEQYNDLFSNGSWDYKMNILLKSSYIFDTERKTTFAGFILIEGTRIKDVGPLDATPTNLPAETTIIDCH